MLLLFLGLIVLSYPVFRILDHAFPFPWHALTPQSAVIVTDGQGEPLRMFLPPDDMWRLHVDLEEVSPILVKTFLASEDRYYYYHPGVNPVAILRAMATNVLNGRVVSGGSTITMQVARLADPRRRTVSAKIIESFRALQLERRYTKDQLLELYLNLTPYGGNIVGVGAASYFYFGKTPDKLSLGEAALLTILPRSPNGYDPIRHPDRARDIRNRFLDRLAERGVFSRQEVDEAKNTVLPTAMRKPPMDAPHFCQMAKDQNLGEKRIQTTLDRTLQRVAQSKLKERITWLRNRGIENGAVVIIETSTREVKAMAGSAAFFDDDHHGQINGVLIRRSPGSALKPFLYALAFDRGVVIPESILLDIPTDYSGYVARNYDDRYRGRVTVAEALKLSLNAPAVNLLADVGLKPYYELLREGGLSTLKDNKNHYGLPLVLGACEVTLLDLASLYATLAGGGEYKPVRYLQGMPKAPGKQLFSPEAAYLTTRILTQVERPDMPAAWSLTLDAPTVAWKTGTSFGHRDAWAVGFSSRYIVGVWVGNLDGKAQKGISGSRHAGPLLFEIFRAIGDSGSLPRADWLDIDQIELCAESRHLPTPLCTERITADYLPGRSSIPQDTLYRQIFVDAETGERLEGSCLDKRPSVPMVVKEYPVELVAWWRSKGMHVPEPPPLSPACRDVLDAQGPRIVSPCENTPYRIRRDAPQAFQRIALVAQTPADAQTLFWYQDGMLVARGGTDEQLFLEPEQGEHRLVVLDDRGRMDAVSFYVE